MENYPQLVPLLIIIPSVGAFLNLVFGARLREQAVATIGIIAAALTFVIAVLLYTYLYASGFEAAIINPPFLDGWIRLVDVEIPWQMRVDTLSVTMLLFVTGVGTLIHIYAMGYMHGDPRFHRFFAYLNMFFAFMLILITGNNFLMLFVGWEGVGLCSFLLIGFWFDKAKGVGWRNSNAARKAMIVNRVGDFGLMMGIFLIFWTFGTLDFYRPGELAVPADAHSEYGEESHSETEESAESTLVLAAQETAPEGEAEGGHGAATGEPEYTNNDHIVTDQLGVFGQAERFIEEGHEVDFGPFSLPIETVLTIITLFMLIGVAGKSAQIPLFVWLPDAMAGPTPVSALIHAATMVTAGVYMMVRSNVFFYEAELTSFIVTVVGASTAIVAGVIAVGQWDIKRVLAYSTVSQLGFMVAAVGIGAYGAAMFHLVTHACFKALLFLGSGSVIHGMEHGHHIAHGHGGHGHDDTPHDEEAHASAHKADEEHHPDHSGETEFDPQDMRNMGGLRAKMPVTYVTYVIGTLALAGIFPFAGFWSKDEILADSWVAGLFDGELAGFIAFGLLIVAAGFTAFYMWRQVVLVFHGEPRTEAAARAPESAPSMVIPLLVLGVLSIFVGFMNVPSGIGFDSIFGAHVFTDWLAHTVLHIHVASFNPLVAGGALLIAISAIILAGRIYGSSRETVLQGRDPLENREGVGSLWRVANARMYWDQVYGAVIEQPFNRLAKFLADTLDWAFWHDYFHDTVLAKGFRTVGNILARPVDLGIIDGIVNGIGRVVRGVGGGLRPVQTGYVRTYAVTLLIGVVVVLVLLLLPLIQRG
ncbi:MAG: proton-conducting transporter membrane subunit [bacterium]|nr:proton-conducting transporter membrane subunit [bacterium]